jgi:hypothetical protein
MTENEWANDTDRFALAAHPGKSQGPPPKSTGSQPIVHKRRARLRSPQQESPVPDEPLVRGRTGDPCLEDFHAPKTRCLAPATAGRRRGCSHSSIPQARRRLRGVPGLPAEQKSRYQLVVSDRANADGRMHPQLHADDARARSRRLSLRLRERLCSPARTPRCRSSSNSASMSAAARAHAQATRATAPRCPPEAAQFTSIRRMRQLRTSSKSAWARSAASVKLG